MGKTVTADVGEAAVIQHFFHDVVAVGYDGDIDFSKGQIIFCIQFPASLPLSLTYSKIPAY